MQNLTPDWKRDPKKWQNYLRNRQRARTLNGHVVEMALQTLRDGGDIYLGVAAWMHRLDDTRARQAETRGREAAWKTACASADRCVHGGPEGRPRHVDWKALGHIDFGRALCKVYADKVLQGPSAQSP